MSEPAPRMPDASAPLEAGEPDLAARRLGSCTLVRRLASGGMGVVYEALQEPPGRTVAVKVLRAALAGDDGRLRFEHEARVLGHLQHPGIAQIYATGTTRDDAGEELPYFVMEHVPQARTLLEHARARALATEARLRLFARVCDAVHFGHTKGVIHRDLKPDNVLVDGAGAPKVIDFGIARSLEPLAGEQAAPHTETGMLVGTLQYMSPEQLRGVPAAVDTRSDVYALGVILYELLTGRLPYALDGLGLVEVARVITASPPLPPSRFAPETAGDLSVILAKALAKDPEQRYASAAALGQDVERYLALTPIQARPPSLAYQLRLLARRHRGAVAVIALCVLALLGAVVVSAWFAAREAAERREAERQRGRAESMLARTRELVPWLLREFDAELVRLPGSVLPRSHLAARLGEHLDALAVTDSDHPSVLEAAMAARGALGAVLGGTGSGHLGRRAEATAQFTLALELLARRAAQGGDPVRQGLQRAELLLARAATRKELGETAAARDDVEAAHAALLAVRAQAGLPAERLLLQTLTRRADLDWAAGRTDLALAAYAEVLAAWQGAALATAPEADRREGQVMAHLALAQCLMELKRPAEAEPHVRAVDHEARALEQQPQLDPGQLHLLYYMHDNLGRGLLEAGQLEAATGRFTAALRAAERQLEHDARNADAQIQVHNAHMLLGRAASEQGQLALAGQHFERALALSEVLGADEPPGSNLLWDRRWALTRLGQTLSHLGRTLEAEATLLRAQPLAEARAAAVPSSGSFLGLRDVWSELSNVYVRRFRAVLVLGPRLQEQAHAALALVFSRMAALVVETRARLVAGLLRRAREHLGRARDALERCRATPEWNESYARDLARIDASLAAMDEALAPVPTPR